MGFDWALQLKLDLAGKNPLGGKGFFVDSNAGVDKGDGRDEQSPWKSLNYGLARSNADIAASPFGWTARNRIYVKSDDLAEDLVLLAQKTDVIGMGHFDRYPFALLIGNHVPTGASASYGTRFFNMMFRAAAAGGDIFTLDSYAAWLQFLSCRFDSQSAVAATAAIVAVAATHLRILANDFIGKFTDSVIEIGTGNARGLRIEDNYIEGADNGIELKSDATDGSGASEELIQIARNKIVTVEIGINDVSGLAYLTDNNVFTDNAKGSNGAGAIVGALDRGQGNRITTSDANNVEWPALGAL